MRHLLKSLPTLLVMLAAAIYSYDPVAGSPMASALNSANISPEIVNELKDFEHLIPAATLDAIVAEHLVVDGKFRKAFKYLRSNEFTHLQKQLLDVPEIIAVLEFLHMTSNATAGTPTPTMNRAVPASSSTVNDNGIDEMTANTVTTGTGTMATSASAIEAGTRDVLAYKRPQLDKLENTVDVSGGAALAEQLPLVDIVLLDAKLNTRPAYGPAVAVTVDDGQHQQRHHHPLGSFTSFVEEIIGQLPQAAYQHMIIDKCKRNAKFADFYRALRSAEFKPLVDEAMKTPNILKIINTLSANDIDVKSLEPIAFKVISWGPNV